jgi:hypothetical protein
MNPLPTPDLTLRNLGVYCIVALANMLAVVVSAGLIAGTVPGFRVGEFLAPATGLMVALLAIVVPILTAWLAANRPRLGSEHLAAQVSELGAEGVPKRDMIVVPRDDEAPPNTAELLAAIAVPLAAALRAEMERTPAGGRP